MPAVLHAIGTTQIDIDNAVKQAIVERQKRESVEKGESSRTEEEHEMAMQERKAQVDKVKKETTLVGHHAQ